MKKNRKDMKKKLRKGLNRIWLKSVPLVVVIYVAMMLSFVLAGNKIVESGVRTAIYLFLVIIGVVIGHKFGLRNKLNPIPDNKKGKIRRGVRKIWLKAIPLVVVLYAGMMAMLVYLSGNTPIIAGFKILVFFLLIMIGMVIGNKLVSYQRMRLFVPEDERDMGINEPPENTDEE